MSKDWLTDEQVEIEIAMLRDDPAVKLAQAEQRHKYKRRQQLYTLRFLKKRGEALMANGITEDSFNEVDNDD